MDPLAVLAYGAEQALPLTGTGTVPLIHILSDLADMTVH